MGIFGQCFLIKSIKIYEDYDMSVVFNQIILKIKIIPKKLTKIEKNNDFYCNFFKKSGKSFFQFS